MKFAIIKDMKLESTWKAFVTLFHKLFDIIVRYQTIYTFSNKDTLNSPKMIYSVLPSSPIIPFPDPIFITRGTVGLVNETFYVVFLSFLMGTLMTLVNYLQRTGILLNNQRIRLEDAYCNELVTFHNLDQVGDDACSDTFTDSDSDSDSDSEYQGSASGDQDSDLESVLSYYDKTNDFVFVPHMVGSSMFNGHTMSFGEGSAFDLRNLSVRYSSIRSLGLNTTASNNQTTKASEILIW
ncbi:HGR032Wp [Eremothecium sinecaudum]|uniref:HGR032Wp n=1 Tax=Eremothecium sinecaudum TaxID=45286 RepID=A0A0X8HVP5_9SACH|nr:HGR032Wp [Eremothecium sinecaudum]AMD22371.1 HGR032Wp [Eremothecium sinecaudum]